MSLLLYQMWLNYIKKYSLILYIFKRFFNRLLQQRTQNEAPPTFLIIATFLIYCLSLDLQFIFRTQFNSKFLDFRPDQKSAINFSENLKKNYSKM